LSSRQSLFTIRGGYSIELDYAELLGQCSRLDQLGGRLTSVLVANELLNALVATS
jgi:hypothetical protein